MIWPTDRSECADYSAAPPLSPSAGKHDDKREVSLEMTITWSLNDVAQHNSQRSVRLVHSSPKSDLHCASDCWVIVDGKVYDVTDFLPVGSVG